MRDGLHTLVVRNLDYVNSDATDKKWSEEEGSDRQSTTLGIAIILNNTYRSLL